MSSPKVIFNCKYTCALNGLDNKNKNNIFKRNRVLRKVNGMFDYYLDEEKRVINMFDYYTGDINKKDTVNLVIEDGSYATNEEVNKRKNLYTKYINKSNLWQCVISFNNDYIDQNINLKDLEQKMIKQIIPKFFTACGFKSLDNMSYQIALHSDTDNYHFHFSFIEKRPNYIGSKNKLSYRRYGKLKEPEIEMLKNQTVLTIERENKFTPMLKSVNQEIDEMKKYFKSGDRNFVLRDKKDLILEENILRLGEMLYEDKKKRELLKSKIKYNSVFNNDIKNLTKNIRNYLFSDRRSSLFKQKDCINQKLDDLNNYLNSLSEQNNLGKKKSKNSLVIQKEEYIDNYIYNSIVNSAYYKYGMLLKKKKYVKVDDVVQEAILQEYKRNRKNSRLSILKDYLSSTNKNIQFKNKYKIEQAIRNINSEMEEAQEKFHDLFKSNSYNNES